MACPVCRKRKGKRACPAKGEAICAACCGSKRRVEIDCPDDCVWLGAHAGAWEGRQTEQQRDVRRIAPFLQSLSEAQGRLFFLFLMGLNGIRSRRAELDDRLLAQALATLLRTVQTRRKGILYDHQAEDARAQALVREVDGLFSARDESGREHTPSDEDLAAVLGAASAAVEAATRDDGSHVFLDTAARVVARLGGAPHAPPRGPLIVEP